MTATLTRPRADSARVTCAKCGAEFELACDEIRRLVEADEKPACGRGWCELAARKRAAAEERAARAAARAAVPSPVRHITQHDRVLLAVADLEQPHVGAWQSAVVVSAWVDDPAAFGLPGFEALHPHSNRVVVVLCQLVSRGWLARPAAGCYRLTDAGTARLQRLRPGAAA